MRDSERKNGENTCKRHYVTFWCGTHGSVMMIPAVKCACMTGWWTTVAANPIPLAESRRAGHADKDALRYDTRRIDFIITSFRMLRTLVSLSHRAGTGPSAGAALAQQEKAFAFFPTVFHGAQGPFGRQMGFHYEIGSYQPAISVCYALLFIVFYGKIIAASTLVSGFSAHILKTAYPTKREAAYQTIIAAQVSLWISDGVFALALEIDGGSV
jgi:hypothetical protein